MTSMARSKRLEGWIGLAAAPALAGMALFSHLNGGADLICTGSRFNGMATMYIMMACVHLRPWLQWLSLRHHP
jgi:hypothetical protein